MSNFIRLGNTEYKKIFVGNTEIRTAFIGNTEYYSSVSIIDRQVNASEHDSTEFTTNNNVRYDGINDARAGRFANDDMVPSFLFDNITIPQGATITAAYLQFTAFHNLSGTVNVDLHCIDEDDTLALDAGSMVRDRPRTSNSVAWTIPDWTASDRGPDQKTPDLKSIVQEVVDRSGWSSGNRLAFVGINNGGANTSRTVKTYDFDPVNAASLHIEYSV